MMFKSSWDMPEDSKSNGNKIFNFWLRSGETKRIIFLQDAPVVAYEHELYPLTKKSGSTLCPKKNGLANYCPICDELDQSVLDDRRLYARRVGYSTVIDLGMVSWSNGEAKIMPYTDRDGNEHPEWNGQKRLFRGKYGSESKPGTWRVLADKRKRIGTLAYTVWDVTRHGDKDPSVGSDFEFVTKLDDPRAVLSYLAGFGIDRERLTQDLVQKFNYSEVLKPEPDSVIKSYLERAGLIVAPEPPADEWGTPFGDDPGFNTNPTEDNPFQKIT